MHYLLSAEDGVFVARCLELELASDGPTEAQAIANLYEALDLYSAPGVSTGTDQNRTEPPKYVRTYFGGSVFVLARWLSPP